MFQGGEKGVGENRGRVILGMTREEMDGKSEFSDPKKVGGVSVTCVEGTRSIDENMMTRMISVSSCIPRLFTLLESKTAVTVHPLVRAGKNSTEERLELRTYHQISCISASQTNLSATIPLPLSI